MLFLPYNISLVDERTQIGKLQTAGIEPVSRAREERVRTLWADCRCRRMPMYRV